MRNRYYNYVFELSSEDFMSIFFTSKETYFHRKSLRDIKVIRNDSLCFTGWINVQRNSAHRVRFTYIVTITRYDIIIARECAMNSARAARRSRMPDHAAAAATCALQWTTNSDFILS